MDRTPPPNEIEPTDRRSPPSGTSGRLLTAALSICLFAFLSIFLFACAFELPQAPYFETTITVPLGRERVSGWDLANESEFVFGDSTDPGPLRLFFEGAIDTFRTGGRMDVHVPGAEFSASLDGIDFPDPRAIDEAFRIGELTELTIPDGGSSIVVPAFSIPTVQRRLPTQESFLWLRVESGHIDLFVRNLLPVSLGVEGNVAPALGLRLVDPADERVVFETELDRSLPPGGATTLVLDLAGVEIPRRMDLEVYGESPGSFGEAVLVRPEDGLDLRVTFRDIEPDSVVALIPAQSVQLEDTLEVDLRGDLGIVGGSFLEGTLPIVLTNDLPVVARGTLTFAQLLEDGSPMSLALELPAARAGRPGRFDGMIDLEGRSVRSLDGEPLDQLTYLLDVETRASPGVVALGRRQRVVGSVGETELRFASVLARPELTQFSFPVTESELDFPSEVEDLELVQASLRIVLENTIAFPARASAVVRGISASETVEIPFSFEIEPGDGSGPKESSIELTETNSDLLRLIRARPTLLEIEGEVLVGTDGRTATVERNDWIRGRYEIGAPLRVRVGTYERNVDDFDFTVSTDLQERIREDLVGLIARGQIENHFPLAAVARITFASSLERLDGEPEVELEAVELGPGVIDPTTGRVRESSRSDFEIALPDEEIPFFGRDRVFGRISLRLLGDSLSVVELTGTDFAEISGALEFRVGVGEETNR